MYNGERIDYRSGEIGLRNKEVEIVLNNLGRINVNNREGKRGEKEERVGNVIIRRFDESIKDSNKSKLWWCIKGKMWP